jgi:hypothetical protein
MPRQHFKGKIVEKIKIKILVQIPSYRKFIFFILCRAVFHFIPKRWFLGQNTPLEPHHPLSNHPMEHRSLDPQLDPVNWEDDSSESLFSDVDSASPRKRARLCSVVSHVRPGQKVHPDSAYVGTSMHDLAITAKPEFEVLSAFIVLPLER